MSAIHTRHPDIHTNGLADGCPRCTEHAHHPWDLDAYSMRDAWQRMLRVEFDGHGTYRSTNERVLCRKLYEFALIVITLGADPKRLFPKPPPFDWELHEELQALDPSSD